MRKRLGRTLAICIFLVFINVADGFPSTYPVSVNVDTAQNLGAISDVFRPGLFGDWSDGYIPLKAPLSVVNKKPFFRFKLGIVDASLPPKPANFEQNFQYWLNNTVDPQISKYQNAGYQVVISLTQVPKWLSLYPSDSCMPNADGCFPEWAFSPPNDYTEWDNLITLLVSTQITDGIRADYIIWDEPDWMFYGTLDQYLELYNHSVKAIKNVNPGIKVGGPAVSNIQAPKGLNCPAAATGLPDGECPPSTTTIMESFIQYASANSLPLDFIDWHFPQVTDFQTEVDGAKTLLTRYGLPVTTPISIGEWVFSPAGETESTEAGSAYAAVMMKQMLDNGIYRHTATSIYDQNTWTSGDWAHVGYFDSNGVIKAKWNSFKTLDKITGQRLKTTASNENEIAAVASSDNNRIAVLLADQADSVDATLNITNIPPGNYTYRKYLIDGDMNVIHSNPCRYNKKTEAAPSTTECGVNGAIDQAIANARTDVQNAVTSYLLSAGISQDAITNLFVCYNDPTCQVVTYISTYCQNNVNLCKGKKPAILAAQQLYNNLFYHGTYRINSGKVFTTSTYIDQINNLKEVSLEGSKQEKQISVTNGTYTEVVNMLPYSVVLIELLP